ncbi:MAG: hypothetical protein QME81_13465 [bacterium]|nr:hypothetical protein [bacterium]
MGNGVDLTRIIKVVVEFLDLFMSSKRCRLIRAEVELVDIILFNPDNLQPSAAHKKILRRYPKLAGIIGKNQRRNQACLKKKYWA